MSSAVVVFSLLPLILNRILDDEKTIWLVSSSIYLAVIVASNLGRLQKTNILRKLDSVYGVVTIVAGTSAVIMLGSNLWLRTDVPYLVQLFVAWLCSLILFAQFISDMLSERDT